ncbi:DNA methyltransferase [Deinococcus sp.]|uniref:DNA methyltransferase n=1 Tax=Deinococcus sp. TaxID=47478 RepID=UPI0025BEBDC2|nr:DNA methyltransferase [Deinococcus sp.]
MPVELIWDGKYDQHGKRVQPVRLALPFQTIETINESNQQRMQTLDMFSSGKDAEWRNRLIWGDKKYVLPSLLEEFRGKVDLIYIDPPFATGSNFSFTASLPEDPDGGGNNVSFTKQPNVLEQKAYNDTWGKGLDGFVGWLSETLLLLKDLLSENGSIYVQLDDHMAHYGKILMDEIFGIEAFRNDITWQRTNSHNINPKYYLRVQDRILYYSRGDYSWSAQRTEYSAEQLARYKADKSGRMYTGQDLTIKSSSASRRDVWRGTQPGAGRAWALSLEEREKLWDQGLILTKSDGSPRLDGLKIFLDEREGKRATDLWNDIQRVGNTSDERLNYPTQKPEALLERIIKASSNPGDLVLDCFCGSGTTAAVAEKLGRRWITCDLGRFAIHTARKRLLSIEGVKPFVVQNLGKYERQAWQAAEWDDLETARAREVAYRQFILQLYGAEELPGGTWTHGLKAGRLVHVGAVDAPVTEGDLKAIVREVWQRAGAEGATASADVLGWDFAFELNETGLNMAKKAGVEIKFKKIPREVLEKKAVDQGDIRFYELGAAEVGTEIKGRRLTLTLKDFLMPQDDIPQDVQKSITHWSQLVDYWAIDWDFKGDTFHNQWQAYRTRKQSKLEQVARHDYEARGTYTVLVKVIDILGNDTTKTLTVEVI